MCHMIKIISAVVVNESIMSALSPYLYNIRLV